MYAITAREWYEDYAWHYTPAEGASIELSSIPCEWLADTESAIERLMTKFSVLDRREAEYMVKCAQEIYQDAVLVERWLNAAIEAKQAGDDAACKQALGRAASIERDHGDYPAARNLAEQLYPEGVDLTKHM